MARHLITSALPYINGSKHLGNLIGSLLPADVTARHLRRRGHDVHFVCATDEHGAVAELAAEASGEDVGAFCDRNHDLQAQHYRSLGLSFDAFGRTSHPDHHRRTREIYQALRSRGFVVDRTVPQLFCPADGRFLSDRYVIGTCPHCGDPSARGDQCDACGALTDPTSLGSPRSALSGSTDLEIRSSHHAFLRLSALQSAVDAYVTETADQWPPIAGSIARSWLAEGLRDRCITRDLAWGVAVPNLPGKVFWCWFDAPIAYLTLAPGWWDPDRETTITQFLGKDNALFHAVWFPAVLAGVGGHRLPDHIHALHWLNWYGEKFSTRRGHGIFLDRALTLLPTDVWRWALLSQAPETADSRFTWEQLASVVNKDLVGQLGNLVQRTQRLTARHFAEIPTEGRAGGDEAALIAAGATTVAAIGDALDARRYRGAIDGLRDLFRLGNRYIDGRAPWQRITVDRGDAATVLRTVHGWIRLIAAAVAPVIPQTSGALFDVVSATDAERRTPAEDLLRLDEVGGRPLCPRPPLFERVGDLGSR